MLLKVLLHPGHLELGQLDLFFQTWHSRALQTWNSHKHWFTQRTKPQEKIIYVAYLHRWHSAPSTPTRGPTQKSQRLRRWFSRSSALRRGRSLYSALHCSPGGQVVWKRSERSRLRPSRTSFSELRRRPQTLTTSQPHATQPWDRSSEDWTTTHTLPQWRLMRTGTTCPPGGSSV